jgi:hypothetical protein
MCALVCYHLCGCVKRALNLARSPREAPAWLMAALTRFPAKACPAHLDGGWPGFPAEKTRQDKKPEPPFRFKRDGGSGRCRGNAEESCRPLKPGRTMSDERTSSRRWRRSLPAHLIGRHRAARMALSVEGQVGAGCRIVGAEVRATGGADAALGVLWQELGVLWQQSCRLTR